MAFLLYPVTAASAEHLVGSRNAILPGFPRKMGRLSSGFKVVWGAGVHLEPQLVSPRVRKIKRLASIGIRFLPKPSPVWTT